MKLGVTGTRDGMTAAQPSDPGRGGTWYTINFAKKRGRPLAVVLPDGTIEEFNHHKEDS